MSSALENQSGKLLHVHQAFIAESAAIPVGSSISLCPIGKVTIAQQDGTTWVYTNILNEARVPERYVKETRHLFNRRRLHARLVVDEEGRLFLVPFNSDKQDFKTNQPEGYPLLPAKKSKEAGTW